MTYMLLFLGLAAQPEAADAQSADYNSQWGARMADLAARGALLSGSPFQGRGSVVQNDSVSELQLERVDIGGYALIEADDDDAAVAIAKQAPHMALGGTTVVRPLIARAAA